jgi:hypothetical protein
VPIVGAFVVRRRWRLFRARFDDLRLSPILDYGRACGLGGDGGIFRFFGEFESINGKILWAKGGGLTIPIDLSGAKVFLLPSEEEVDLNGTENEPRPIKWDQISEFSEGARIFVGGKASPLNGRPQFASSKEDPLLIILYDGQDRSLLMRAVRAGRKKNEYWNPATPYSFAFGIFAEVLMALSFANRPAFSVSFAAALTFAFIPLIPFLPPGVLLTAWSRSLWRRGRAYRALRDLVKLPLRHLMPGMTETRLPDGARYGRLLLDEEQLAKAAAWIPKFPPNALHTSSREFWHCYGAIAEKGGTSEGYTVSEPADPSAVFAAVASDPLTLARGYSWRARFSEIESTAAFACGFAMNAVIFYALLGMVMNAF